MFWVKTSDGNICNLARASDVEINPDGTIVMAIFTHSESILFSGTNDECRAYRAALIEELRGHSGDCGPAFHDVRLPEPEKPGDPNIPF